MIFIYGDSHGDHCFKRLEPAIQIKNLYEMSITMFRVGRDNKILNFNKSDVDMNDTVILSYGEIDCRCHIQRQINTGRNEDDVITELVDNYFRTIQNNLSNNKIIIVGVIPPTKQSDYEKLNGPITHEYPFVGTDQDRVRYTNKVNRLIEHRCATRGYIFFNPFDYYTRPDGTLKYEFSDSTVHLGNNTVFLEKFIEMYNSL
jgi:hypothetical protein